MTLNIHVCYIFCDSSLLSQDPSRFVVCSGVELGLENSDQNDVTLGKLYIISIASLTLNIHVCYIFCDSSLLSQDPSRFVVCSGVELGLENSDQNDVTLGKLAAELQQRTWGPLFLTTPGRIRFSYKNLIQSTSHFNIAAATLAQVRICTKYKYDSRWRNGRVCAAAWIDHE